MNPEENRRLQANKQYKANPKKQRKQKIETPHEFRSMAQKDIFTGKNYWVVNHYDHGKQIERLPIHIPDAVLARQFCAVINKVFKLGIGWGYNYAKIEELTDEQQLVLTEDDIHISIDLQGLGDS